MSNTDLHALYYSRAIAKARAFVNRGGAASSSGNNSSANGAGGGNGLSKSPGAAGFAVGGSLEKQAVYSEVNRRDYLGRTVLHLAVMEKESWALDWVEILLKVPGLQVNLPDLESGWTALHRALYSGNIAAAKMLLARDDIDSRAKDSEGLSPFDVFNSTVDGTNPSDHFSAASHPNPGRLELFSWGSNRNYVLGFPSDSERQFPERVQLKREDLKRDEDGLASFEPCRVKDVSMARLHTGIVTDEKRGNVKLCGYGTGGRLGPTTQTQFTFAPIKDFAHQVSSIVLSPDHTVLVTTAGDVYTFGLNRFQQLGYPLDSAPPTTPSSSSFKNTSSSDEPIQSNPRRVVGALKKEVVLGAAASRTHTAVFTADSLYTWGTNRGQLGYPAAGTPVQVLPRKVTLVSQPVIQLTATENATACLLESRDVVVLYHEAYLKIAFPLTPFPSKMQTYRPPRVGAKPNIRKVASCGNTFAALSSLGDVFTFTLDSGSSTSSAANTFNGGGGSSVPFFSSPDGTSSPGSALARLTPRPQRIWNLRRKFTAVTDVGVGLDGSIILCTVSGHVFLRSKKYESSSTKASGAMTPSGSSSGGGGGGYKFSRVPYLQRVIKVAANSTGGFAALRADVPLRFIEIEGATLAKDFLSILPHWKRIGPVAIGRKPEKKLTGGDEDGEGSDGEEDSDLAIERDIEVAKKLLEVSTKWDLTWEVLSNGTDAVVKVGLKSIPVHKAVVASRSRVLADHLSSSRTLDLDCSDYTALLFVHYLYSDEFPAIWDSRIGLPLRSHLSSEHKLDYGVIKTELRRLALDFDLRALAESLERQVKNPPSPTLASHLASLLQEYPPVKSVTPSPALRPDIILVLADREVTVHSAILRARCPFFSTFFDDPVWSERRKEDAKISRTGTFELKLKHLDGEVMDVVLEHIYRDAGMSLFQSVRRPTTEEFIDFTVRVLAAANELLLDKLKQVCSAVLRSFVTLNNVCSILCDAAFYEANDLVRACMYFLTTSMETVLESYLLEDLPTDLLVALTAFVQERQGAKSPISRSGLLLQELLAKHAEYVSDLDVGRPTGGHRKFRPNIPSSNSRPSPSLLSPGPSPQLAPTLSKSPRMRPTGSPNASPSLPAVREDDEPFALDEDFLLDQTTSPKPASSSTSVSTAKRRQSYVPLSASPSQPSFMPLGSPPPSRLQPWAQVTPEATRSPLDLRSIMASESSATPKRSATAAKTPLSPPSVTSSPFQSNLPSASTSNWRPVAATRAPSLAEIQQSQAASTPRRPSIPHNSASTPPVPSVSRPARPSPSPSTSSPVARPSDPANASGPVYTPSRLVSRSSSSSQRLPKSSFGGSDTPWQNFDRITTSPPPPIPSPSSSFDPFAPAPTFSLASIMSEQKAQVEAVKDHKAPRSFADVMAQEQAAARRKEEEDREAREFEKWFAEEAKRVQAEEAAIRAAVTGGSGGGGGKTKKGGKSSKPSTGGGPAGQQKGGKKQAVNNNGSPSIRGTSGATTAEKGKKTSKGGKPNVAGVESRAPVAGVNGGPKGKGKSTIGGAESVPFTPSFPV
ncbi:uncharacterized protein JCM6883_001232 [Sporobolomyces salmoneus]|uniref:uncharacterized protein n=1 Tax=Sporobolomyces salmoneus TaxID=183962 RepID=UPI0031824979